MSQSEQRERGEFSNELLQFALEQVERFGHTPDGIGVDALAVIALSVKLLISALRSLTDAFFDDAAGGVLNMSVLYIPTMGPLTSQLADISEVDNKSVLLPLPPGGNESLSTKVPMNRFRTMDGALVELDSSANCTTTRWSTIYAVFHFKLPKEKNMTVARENVRRTI
jgi:hypothetical protein